MSTGRRIRYYASAILPLAALSLVAPADAQVLEEITVTAQKREQNLQDVGVAVTAFTARQISELGFTNTTDVVSMTPGLNYTVPNAESSVVNFFLRGVGLNDFADANENPVAVYVDEIYRPASGGLSAQLFDMERVEVLRGPQGTLFGRNTTGGLVHYISRKPSQESDGYAELTFGENSQIKFEGALGGPLGDRAAARLSVGVNNHDGYTENRVPGVPDYNEANAVAARGQLLFNPSDKFEVHLNAFYSDNDATVGAWQHQVTTLAGEVSVPLGPNETTMTVDCDADGMLTAADARTGTDCLGYRDTDGDPFAGDYDRDGVVKTEASGISAKLTWRSENYELTSITALQSVDRLQEEDTEASPIPAIVPTFGAETETLSQELRISGGGDRLQWLGGLYYFDNDVDGHYLLDLTQILGFVFFDAQYQQDTESLAAFGQFEYALNDRWSVIAGARFADEDKELDYLNVDTAGFFTDVVGLPSNVAFDFDQASVGDLAKHSNTSFSGKLELDWRPKDDLLLYGSYSRGVKSAGFNVGFLDENLIFASNTAATVPFDEETLNSFEVGLKSTVFNGTTRLNASAFYYDYKDFQTFRFELLNQVIFNADAEVKGVELELASSPTEHWDFALGLSLLDATAKDIPSPSGALRDRDMVAAPDLSINALARYQWEAAGGMFALQAWGNYQDDIYYDIQNHPISFENGYTVGNLRGSYTSGNGHWSVAAFLNNFTDEEYLIYTFDFTGPFGFNQQAYGQPRWGGVSFRYSF